MAQLTPAQQDTLRQAASETRDWCIAVMIDPAEGAAQYCKAGGTVVNTTDKNLAELRTATHGVYAELEQDPQNQILHRPDPHIQDPCCHANASQGL